MLLRQSTARLVKRLGPVARASSHVLTGTPRPFAVVGTRFMCHLFSTSATSTSISTTSTATGDVSVGAAQPSTGVKRRLALDITGNTYSCSPHSAFPRMDDGIMSVLTQEKDASDIMKECVEADPECALAHVLLIFEYCRHWSPNTSSEELLASLQALDDMARSGALTQRELFLGCAADAWLRGEHARAGLVLEHLLVITDCRHDALALKLCQESFTMAGDPVAALRCITESGMLLQEDHLLHGDVLVLLATGLNENGRWTEAEVVANDAVRRTRGRSSSALSALMTALLMSGRGSEAYGVLYEHEKRHKHEAGRLALLSAGAGAKFLRGEYGQAASYLFQMLDWMDEFKCYPRDGIADVAIGIWMLELSSVDRKDLQELGIKMALVAAKLAPAPLDAMNGSAMASLFVTGERRLAALKEEVGDGMTGEQRILQRVTGITPGARPTSIVADETSTEDMRGLLDAFRERLVGLAQPQSSAELRSDGFGAPNQLHSLRGGMPTLREVAPAALRGMHTTTSSGSGSTVDSGSGSGNAAARTLEVMAALEAFEDGSDAGLVLRILGPDSASLGGSAWQRHVMGSLTAVEALLRAGRCDEARTLLSDRTSRAPSDGQAWWRLAAVMDVVGPHDMAAKAHLQANTLGLGQGGFKRYEPYRLPSV